MHNYVPAMTTLLEAVRRYSDTHADGNGVAQTPILKHRSFIRTHTPQP